VVKIEQTGWLAEKSFRAGPFFSSTSEFFKDFKIACTCPNFDQMVFETLTHLFSNGARNYTILNTAGKSRKWL
jgi:hypothetical protein